LGMKPRLRMNRRGKPTFWWCPQPKLWIKPRLWMNRQGVGCG